LPRLRVFADLLIVVCSVFLLTPGLSSKANSPTDGKPQFPLPNQLILQEQKVVPSDGMTDSYFGWAVALDSSTALIGAYGDNDFQGAAYLFPESNGIWSEDRN
jgi:FG-GAP repeat